MEGDRVFAWVAPLMIGREHPLYFVSSVHNGILVKGNMLGTSMFYGSGAGKLPTASAVVADITDVCLNLKFGSNRRIPGFTAGNLYENVLSIDKVKSRYYLSLQVVDLPGVLAKITNILAAHSISISSVVQKERKDAEHVSLVILTHSAAEKSLRAALAE